MNLSQKQIELLCVIDAGNDDESKCDLDQILERLNYKPSKESVQFSIRALIKHGLIAKLGRETRRGQSRVIIASTELGYMFAKANRKRTLAEELTASDDFYVELEPI